MEQNPVAGTPITPAVDNRQKSGNGLKITAVVASILAICGIGFGIYGIFASSQKDNQISDLKTQVEDSNDKIASLEAEKDNTAKSSETTAVASESAIKNEKTEDYIYIGEWGVKIKVPESLIGKFGYNFSNNNYLEVTDYASVYTYGQQLDWNTSNVLKIVRSKAGETDFENCLTSCAKLITTLNGYDYSYMLSGGNLELLQSTALNEMTKKDAFSEF